MVKGKQSFEHLDNFFQRIKTLSFFERLFSWKTVLSLSYDAYTEFKSTNHELAGFEEELHDSESRIKELTINYENQKDKSKEIAHELEKVTEKYEQIRKQDTEKGKQITRFETEEERKQQDYEKKVTELNTIKKQLDDDLLRIKVEREREITERHEKLKETWRKHESLVEATIKSICQRHSIECIPKEKVPFKGKPDNAVQICDEIIVFDAKSPADDNLENFPTYIRAQAEAVKKYIKEKDVRKEIFLVIPSNAVSVIEQFYFNMADYTAYVVTVDSLEPILLSLKQLENYEFVDQLSPEERENICRVIGKFAHATKRRIQVDNYFNSEMIALLTGCYSLPPEILTKVVEYEKSNKMNPPQEKRAKLISQTDIQKDIKRIKQEAKAKEIDMEQSLESIEQIPLYKKE